MIGDRQAVETAPACLRSLLEMTMLDSKPLIPGGIDGSTGQPLSPPDVKEALLNRLAKPKRRFREVIDGVDPKRLDEAGWGIVVAEADDLVDDALEALQPLSDLRRREAGARYKVFLGADGYLRGEDKLDFLSRHGAGPGRVDPQKVPYYLLLVGSPEHIPYEFQYGLDLHHAVGRVYFETKEEYASYARGVVNAAAGLQGPPSARKVAFFGPCQDEGTEVSYESLLKPLIERVRTRPDCQVREFLGEGATKAALGRILGGEETPNLLFSAGHGLQYRSGHRLQQIYQGALVCQDWPGKDAPYPEQSFTGDDLDEQARLLGLISFLFACHSAGTPKRDDFASTAGGQQDMAPLPFVSHLAQRLLGHPQGGALAVIGHVHQVWQQSFYWRQTGSQPMPFLETVNRLLDGGPLGWAMEPLNQRFADLSVALGELLKEAFLGGSFDLNALAELWLASQDARNYVIVGDPAVRLPGKKRVLRG
ncbi:MAG: hypothetical protein ABUT39_00335 [Acidobacteriota bacterium]